MSLKTLVAVMLVWTVSACGPGADEMTGGDGSRGEAQTIAIDTTLDDRVSVGQGDSNDWKTFELEGASKVTVKVWWDNPSVGAQVTLRDELGKQVATLKHKGGQRAEQLGPVKLKEGTYFLQISATGGASVYTYEVSTGAAGGGAVDF